jgi:hypothetical protein
MLGWPTDSKEVNDSVKPFFKKKTELSCEKGCIMWGYRIVIPTVLRQAMLKEF